MCAVRVVTCEVHAQRASSGVAPVVLGHLGILTAEPRHVLASLRPAFGIEQELSMRVAVPPQNLTFCSQLKQFARQLGLLAPYFLGIPVHPRDGRVLAIGVVVALLSAAKLIATGDHGHTDCQDQGRQEVPRLTVPQGIHRRNVSLALYAAVP